MKTTLKRIAQAFLLLGFVVLAWYGQSRLSASIRSVNIEQVSPSSATAGEPSPLTLILLESGLLKVGDPAMQDDYLTFPSANPDKAIDWILCSPSLTQTDTWVVKSGLSDHLMVVGRVTD